MMSEVPTGSAPLASEDGEPGSPSLELYSRPAAKKKIMLFSNPLDGLRKKVSKDRNRYTDGTYDLDLTYITENVIGARGAAIVWRIEGESATRQREVMGAGNCDPECAVKGKCGRSVNVLMPQMR